MAKGQLAAKTVVVNNVKATIVSQTIELVVKDGGLVPDEKDLNPGVNSANLKN